MADRLRALGWVVLARNWSGGGGELDVVVRRGDTLRFVEVKARESHDLDPLESITPGKQRKLIKAAMAWLRAHQPDVEECCFLVAVVDLATERWAVDWVDDAFDGS